MTEEGRRPKQSRRSESAAAQVAAATAEYQPSPSDVSVVPAGAAGPVTTRVVPRVFEMYLVLGQELEALAAGMQSVHLAFFGTALGALLTSGVVLSTTSLNPIKTAWFASLFLVALTFCAYFGVRSWRDVRAARRRVDEIRSRPLKPGG